jgi:hypothetical protein
MNTQSLRSLISAGLLLGSAAAASAAANCFVSFQVDMSNAVANATFDPSSMTMAARGSFNNWTPFALTNNPNGANTNLWTGTFNVTSNGAGVSANGTVMSYKYTIEPSGTYEIVFLGGSHNRLLLLPPNPGDHITAPQVVYGDALQTLVTNQVTFQVDLAQQINTGAFIPGTSTNQARGIFNGWGGTAIAQTNDPTILRTNQNGLVTSNVYVGTYEIVGSPGETIDYKYFIDTGANWESPAPGTGDPADNNNRFFNLGSGPTQRTPIVFFNDSPFAPVATNNVTFQVDMSSQIVGGSFNPAANTVELRGDFNSWGNTQILCTNNPSAPNTNIYSTVVTLVDGVGARRQYKFWASISANGGWETMANNRVMQLVGGPPNPTPLVLPPVLFDDLYIDPASRLSADTTVTFTVNMTNAVSYDGSLGRPFDPTLDSVNINGVPPPFVAWGAGLPQCINNPVGSELYSIDILLPKGSPVQQIYKYGIDELDNEAPAGQNHVRYVRSTGTYVMPLDKFGKQLVENYLTAVPSTPGHVMVTWGAGTHLQTRTSLSSGAWTDHPETIGMYSTNWPTGGGATFFRVFSP